MRPLPALENDTLSGFAREGIKFASFNPQTDEQRDWHWKRFESVRAGFYGRMARRFSKALNDQLDVVIENVRASRSPKDAPRAATAAFRYMDPIYEQAVREVYIQVTGTFADLTLESFPKQARVLQSTKQNEDEWADAANNYVTQNGATLIVEPNGVTRDIIISASRSAASEGVRQGWGIPKIAEEIRLRSQNAVSMQRATVIARTEVIRASNLGAMTAARSTGLGLKKEWIATADDRVRETHAIADQQIVGMNEYFVVGGYPARFPADAMLPGKESIQCRCTVAFIPIT